jgi:DNA-binding CsgD family transcriptional regulator
MLFRNKVLWIGIIQLYALKIVQGQEIPWIRNFTPQQYQSQNQNWSLAQDLNGDIIAGNNEGILKFDGVRWKTTLNQSPAPVRKIKVAPNGKLYYGQYGEFGVIEFSRDSSKFRPLWKDKNVTSKEEIWNILTTKNKVYFQTFSKIYSYNFKESKFINPRGPIMFLNEVHNRIIFQKIGSGLYELNENDSIIQIPNTDILRESIVEFILPYEKNDFIVGTRDQGFFLYKDGQLKSWKPKGKYWENSFQLNKGIRLSSGNYAFGTILNGIFIMDPFGNILRRFNRENGLQNNTVLSLLEDMDKNLWAGLDKGIDLIQMNSPLEYYHDFKGKTGTTYTAKYFKDHLFIGTNQGVFYKKMDENESIFKIVPGSQGQAWDLFVVAEKLYFGHNNGTFLIENFKARKVSNVTGAWKTIPNIQKANYFLQATYTGIYEMELKNSILINWKKLTENNEPYKSIGFGTNGKLFATHPTSGIFWMKRKDDIIEPIKISSKKYQMAYVGKSDLIFSNSVSDEILKETGIKNNKSILSKLNNSFTHYKKLLGENEFWYKNVVKGTWLRWNQDSIFIDEKLVNDYENGLYVKDSTYLICLENGYVLFKKDKFQKIPNRKIYLTGILKNKEFIPLAGNKQVYSFSYDYRELMFQFSQPIFSHKPTIRANIQGVDNVWQEVNAEGLTIGNLPSGQYVLEVKGEGVSEPLKIKFQILSPWYFSQFFVFLYAMLGILGIYILNRFHKKRVFDISQKLQKEKENELSKQKSDLEREILALELANKSRDLSKTTLDLIRRNEMLQKIKDDLMLGHSNPNQLEKLLRQVDYHLEADHDWDLFQEAFNQVHDDFFKKLKTNYPELTRGDLKLCAFLRMNLSSKEIAPLLNISIRGVENKRYRLRTRLKLDETENLATWLISF